MDNQSSKTQYNIHYFYETILNHLTLVDTRQAMKATVLLLLIQLIGEVHAETGPITDHITTMSTVPAGHQGDAHLATDGDLDTQVFVGSDVRIVDGNTEYFSELKAALDGVFCIEKIKINFRKDMVYEFSCEEGGDCTGTNPDGGAWITYVTKHGTKHVKLEPWGTLLEFILPIWLV